MSVFNINIHTTIQMLLIHVYYTGLMLTCCLELVGFSLRPRAL